MNSSNKVCIIVDGYSTGRNYAKLLNQNGYTVLHIQSSTTLPDFVTSELDYKDYFAIHVFRGLPECKQWLRQFSLPKFIIPGADTGVQLADLLSNEFDLTYGNDINKSN